MDIKEFYNCHLIDNNITYSIDMLRLKTYISFETYSKIEFFIEAYFKDKIKKFWISDKKACFHYNYNIEIEEGKSFYFGFHHNSESLNNSEYSKFENNHFVDLYNFTIEFNPNKLKKDNLLMYLLSLSGEWYIKSYDLALDLKVNILDLIYDISGKAVEKVFSSGYDDKTVYLGSGVNRIKIYNKKKESKLNILGDITRIEISREMNDYDIRRLSTLYDCGFFPDIYLNQYVYSLSDYENKNKTLIAILFAVQNGYPIRNLTRDYRNKLKDLLEAGYKIFFSKQISTQVLRQTILSYFLNNDKVHFI